MTVDDHWAESAVERTLGTLAQLNPDFVAVTAGACGRARFVDVDRCQVSPPSRPASPSEIRTPATEERGRHHRRHLPHPPDGHGAAGHPARRRPGQRRGRRAGGVRRAVPQLGRPAGQRRRPSATCGPRWSTDRGRCCADDAPRGPTCRRTRAPSGPRSPWRCSPPSTRPWSPRWRDLAPRQREVLVLRYYGGLSEAEIAEATGLSKGTVKSTASRAVAKLGDIMRAR